MYYENTFDLTYGDFNPTVLFACKQQVTKGSRYHSHEDFAELTFILSGRARYRVEDQIYDLEAGDIIICNPGVKHQNVEGFYDSSVEFYTGFTGFQFKNMPANSILFKDGSCFLRADAETKRELTRRCYEMVAENETGRAGKYFMLKAQLIQMIIIIMRAIEVQEPHRQKGCNFESYNKSYAVKQILGYLEENFEHKISLDRIAKNMYLSPVYISKIFKEETGESPINYLIRIRLEKAKEILETDEGGSVKQVANRVGYEDVYHFSKLFKKYYGVSPLNYRKGHIVNESECC